jgi:hypothetical protein
VTPDPLPPELLDLERELTARLLPEPPAELRSRVLAAVSRERPTPRPELARGGFARFAAATAAAALVAINLSASLANNTDWRLRSPPPGPDVADLAEQIRTLAPNMPDSEARRQALLLRAAATLVPAPVPVPPADHDFWNKEPERWGTR